ncbi:MAG: preprotein translocase subunit SecE [Patescibacteria group bacterium]
MTNFLTTYLRGAWEEMKKVAWPTKREITQHTMLVIGISVVVALFLGALDYIFNFGLEQLLYK